MNRKEEVQDASQEPAADAGDETTHEVDDCIKLEDTKGYWIQTPTGTDKIWLKKDLYEQCILIFPKGQFPLEVGSMLMRFAHKHGIPRSSSGRLLWKTATGMTKSEVATSLLQDMFDRTAIEAK